MEIDMNRAIEKRQQELADQREDEWYQEEARKGYLEIIKKSAPFYQQSGISIFEAPFLDDTQRDILQGLTLSINNSHFRPRDGIVGHMVRQKRTGLFTGVERVQAQIFNYPDIITKWSLKLAYNYIEGSDAGGGIGMNTQGYHEYMTLFPHISSNNPEAGIIRSVDRDGIFATRDNLKFTDGKLSGGIRPNVSTSRLQDNVVRLLADNRISWVEPKGEEK